MNLLIVDDHPDNRKLLRVNLEFEGHSVTEAEDGVEALQALRSARGRAVDAVISDILMPRMDGYRFCYELRRSDDLRDLPVMIYSSTYTSSADESLALQIGADRFFRKPDAFQQLLQAVRGLAEHAPVRPCPTPPPDDTSVLKEYSEALILKLEKRMCESELARVALEGAHRTLLRRNTDLDHAKAQLHRANEILEDRVRERTAELRVANAELETFNYSVSHDLRSPLTAILGFADLLLRHKLLAQNPDAEMFVRRIAEAGHHMCEIVDGLLALAQLGRQLPECEPVDLSGMAADIVYKLQECQPDRKVECRIATGLSVAADAALLRMALQNLLQNAWKFTAKVPTACIEVGVEARDTGPVFFVRDNGAGFDMKGVGELFQPFRRLHHKRDFPGTGIGLATVRRIVQRHGGTIWAESAPNHGAAFYFTL